MSFEATWLDGGSQIPQERPSANVEWEWSGGKSGEIGAEAAGGAPPIEEGVGSATGTATVLGIGASVWAAVASASGMATVTGRTYVVVQAVGNASGLATVAGVGGATVAAVAAGAGSATVLGVGVSVIAATATSAGYATVCGVGSALNRFHIRRVREAPHISFEQAWLFFPELQLELESGMGLPHGQGEDPQVMLQMSNDGGKTWGNEHWTGAGRMGEYRRRVVWRRLGRSRDRMFRIVVTDPVKWCIADSYLDVEPGTS